jgi:hypothetical protein
MIRTRRQSQQQQQQSRIDTLLLGATKKQQQHKDAPASALPSVTRVVKLQRRGNKVVQGCDVYIGRAVARGGWSLARSKFANPFSVAQCGGSALQAVNRYREWLMHQPALLRDVRELHGKTLGCWCKSHPGAPCHGDVLAEMADRLAAEQASEVARQQQAMQQRENDEAARALYEMLNRVPLLLTSRHSGAATASLP